MASSAAGSMPKGTDRPVIGIIALDTHHEEHGKTYIPENYVGYLQQAGARVVPIRGGQSRDYYEKMVSLTNGILIPGGCPDIEKSLYAKSTHHVFDIAKRINREGDYYPLWGTCMGFQIMACMLVGRSHIVKTDADNLSLPLEFTPEASKSRLIGEAPEDIKYFLQNEPITANRHTYSVLLDSFKNTELGSFYIPLSTNKDRKGVEFVSTFEAKDFPFYAVQWHPEKSNLEWNPRYDFNHGEHAVRVSQYMANFFVREARKSSHRFPDFESETASLIQHCKRVIVDNGFYFETYFID